MSDVKELSFSTPTSYIVKACLFAFGAAFALLFILAAVFNFNGGFPLIIVPVIVFLTMRHAAVISADSALIKFGFNKRECSFSNCTFRTSRLSGAKSWWMTFRSGADQLEIIEEGKKPLKLAFNITPADFASMMNAMKERGAKVEAA